MYAQSEKVWRSFKDVNNLAIWENSALFNFGFLEN